MTTRLLRDPLVHFLVIGTGLFLLFDLVTGGERAGDPKTIEVTREGLLTFLQYRARAFEPGAAEAAFAALDGPGREALIAEYVRSEALYREARALRLDAHDFVARQRLIQQVEYLTLGFAEGAGALSAAELAAYYEAHRERFAEPARTTFTHVYFAAERHGAEGAQRLAGTEIEALNGAAVPFEGATGRGERFLYRVNYVDQDEREIASHFGDAFAARLAALTPDPARWQGPIASTHGAHAVLLAARTPPRVPPLAEIEGRVRAEAMEARRQAAFAAAIDKIIAAYEVRRADDLGLAP